MPTPLPSRELVASLLDYDPVSGVFVWKVDRGNGGCSARAGDIAGCLNGKGYRSISVNGRSYRAHRLAWLIEYGESLANSQVDHRDRNRDNNSIKNLRLASHSQNNANSRARTTTGLKGVYRSGRGYKAVIWRAGKYFHLGSFDTTLEASEVFEKAHRELYGEYSPYSKVGRR